MVHRSIWFWVIAFIEGFSTLAVEVIAIRLAIPIVGSSITLTGIVLGVVLLALSAGYWRGGILSARWDAAHTRVALARNLLLAAVLYGAIGFPLEATLLEKLLDRGFPLPAAIGTAAAVLFLIPIYLASQTVPMLAELTNTEGKAGKASGRVLFFSTLGSVAGGVVTPVWLFPSIGVARSTYVVFALLAAAAAMTVAGHLSVRRIVSVGAAAVAILAAGSALLTPHGDYLFSFDSAYQSIRIELGEADKGRTERVLRMGGGRASGVYTDTGASSFEYVLEADKALAELQPTDVLVIGSAGFTFPRDAAAMPFVNRIDAVDVDPVVKRIAEQQFLRQPLPAKVHFLPLSARYAVRRLHQDQRSYGFTFVDAYFGQGIPQELVTLEFFEDLRKVSRHTAFNVIMDRSLGSTFAQNLLATMRQAFGGVWVKDVTPGLSDTSNLQVTSWPRSSSTQWNGTGHIYRDDKNSADRDYVALVWATE